MKRTYIILGLVIIGILIGTFFVVYEWNRKPRDVRSTKPAYTLTTAEFIGEFKKDTAAAAKKFNGNVVQLTGAVSQADDSDSGRRINATFTADGFDLIATFKKSENKNFAGIKPGNEITFKGEFIGLEIDEIMPELPPAIRMDKCVLEEK
jgi:hypothetical protein